MTSSRKGIWVSGCEGRAGAMKPHVKVLLGDVWGQSCFILVHYPSPSLSTETISQRSLSLGKVLSSAEGRHKLRNDSQILCPRMCCFYTSFLSDLGRADCFLGESTSSTLLKLGVSTCCTYHTHSRLLDSSSPCLLSISSLIEKKVRMEEIAKGP